ncbi:hypothetical protein FOZ63_031263, partial [Perkinsus olseni]
VVWILINYLTNTTLLGYELFGYFIIRLPFSQIFFRRMSSYPSLLVNNISTLYTCNGDGDDGLGCINDAAVGFKGGRIVYIGSSVDVHDDSTDDYDIVISGKGLIAIPGMVDCHTHSVWAGTRCKEFSSRLKGTSYVDILQQGGGILSTVRDTRNASLDDLTMACSRRLSSMLNNGVTTCEVKSGYGLCVDTERDMLLAARNAAASSSGHAVPRVTTTFLGAHTLPWEYRDSRDAYLRQVIEDQLPVCAPLADSIDVFCDKGAFTLQEAHTVLSRGKERYGLKVKAHAEQIVHTGCAHLVADLGGVSADHLERLDEEGAQALASSNVVAVMLPGAQLYLRDTSPPIQLLRAKGVTMAVGSDLNPGSSPVHDLLTCSTLSCIIQGLTIPEALLGVTKHAGQALGLPQAGWLAVDGGSYADMVLIEPPVGEGCSIDAIIQHLGGHRVKAVVKDGTLVYRST